MWTNGYLRNFNVKCQGFDEFRHTKLTFSIFFWNFGFWHSQESRATGLWDWAMHSSIVHRLATSVCDPRTAPRESQSNISWKKTSSNKRNLRRARRAPLVALVALVFSGMVRAQIFWSRFSQNQIVGVIPETFSYVHKKSLIRFVHSWESWMACREYSVFTKNAFFFISRFRMKTLKIFL